MKNKMSNFGFSTLLVSFAMICILIFSVLALITANSDYKLSRKVADKNTAYYKAEATAYQILSQTDIKLYEAYEQSTSSEEYYKNAKVTLADIDEITASEKENQYIISLSLSDNQTLDIAIEVTYPASSSDYFYRISKWKNTTDTSVNDEKLLDLLD